MWISEFGTLNRPYNPSFFLPPQTPKHSGRRISSQTGQAGCTLLGDAGFEGCGIITPAKGDLAEVGAQHDKVISQHRFIVEFTFGFTKYTWQILRQPW